MKRKIYSSIILDREKLEDVAIFTISEVKLLSWSQIVQTINLLLVQFFLVALTYYGWVITVTTGQTSLITLDLPQALFRAVIPFSGLIMLLAFGREMVIVWYPPESPGSTPDRGDREVEPIYEKSIVGEEV